MLPLLTALLLAAWILHPWAALAEAGYLDETDSASPATSRLYSPEAADTAFARMERMDEATATPTSVASPEPSPLPTPEPAPTPPAPTPIPMSPLTKPQIEAIICTYPWPCDQALKVMWCESGGKPWAIGRGVNYGLYQINQAHARRFADFWIAWMDPAKNIEWAYALWARQAWMPWACKPY